MRGRREMREDDIALYFAGDLWYVGSGVRRERKEEERRSNKVGRGKWGS